MRSAVVRPYVRWCARGCDRACHHTLARRIALTRELQSVEFYARACLRTAYRPSANTFVSNSSHGRVVAPEVAKMLFSHGSVYSFARSRRLELVWVRQAARRH
eukprot:6201122-Pleurochrysis_carterae.AAC.3